MKSILIILAFIVAAPAFATQSVIKFVPGTQTLDGVNVSKGATVTVAGQQVALTTVAAGIRQHTVLFFHPDIYVGQLLVSNPSVLVKTDADFLPSSDHVNVGAIVMNFVYSHVTMGQIFSAYRDALNKNNVNTSAADFSGPNGFFGLVRQEGDAHKGQTVTLLLSRDSSGKETLTYDNGKGVVKNMTGAPGFLHSIYSIWLGAPADSDIAKLKSEWLSWKAQ